MPAPNQVILITGASSGIGIDAALHLLARGHKVYGVARRLENMQVIINAGGFALKMDITSESDIESVVREIIQREGHIDVLINNAGYGLYGAVEDTNIDDARHQFEVNLFGLARLTQEVLPHMRKRKSGRIINLASIAGKIYMPMGAWYHATKHALEGWSDCLRLEMKQFNIQVVIIEPGIISTGFEDVTIAPLLNRSGNGPYADLALGMAQSMYENYASGASAPAVITKLLIKSVEKKRPKYRYTDGKFSLIAPLARIILRDQILDRIMLQANAYALKRRIKHEEKPLRNS